MTSSPSKKTMTLNLTKGEMQALEDLSKRKSMSKTAILRQALRLYQTIDNRLSAGETIHFSGDAGKARVEILL